MMITTMIPINIPVIDLYLFLITMLRKLFDLSGIGAMADSLCANTIFKPPIKITSRSFSR